MLAQQILNWAWQQINFLQVEKQNPFCDYRMLLNNQLCPVPLILEHLFPFVFQN